MLQLSLLKYLFCWLYVQSVIGENEVFNEELFMKPLPSGHLYSFFQFTTKWNVSHHETDSLRHFNLFPRSLGEIINKHSVRELHVSLTQGLWRTHKWGYPVRYAGSGAEISAWFHSSLKDDDVDTSWIGLVNSLSGLLCASFNFVTLSNTIQPQWSFQPEGLRLRNNNSSHLRFSHLPRENVCTENLTPWKKLLPCESHSGLGELLNAKNLYNSNYHSLALDLRPICSDKKCTSSALELKLSLSLVTDPTVLSPNMYTGLKTDWTFQNTFGSGLFSSCPRAKISKIYIDTTSNSTDSSQWDLKPAAYTSLAWQRGGNSGILAIYDLKKYISWPLNIRAIHKSKWVYGIIPPPLIHATRYVGGHGQARGKLITQIANTYYSSDIEIVHLELVPWYCRVFTHTLTVKNSRTGTVPIIKQYFKHGLDRERPHHLELRLMLPANSVTEIQWEFQRAFLKWTEYPPDAHRGFDLGPAIISALLPVARNWTGVPKHLTAFDDSWNVSETKYFIRLHTEPLVVAMATPDFSMPYNVICLACTVVALAFGPLYNITTKRLVVKEVHKGSGILSQIRAKFSRGVSKQKSE